MPNDSQPPTELTWTVKRPPDTAERIADNFKQARWISLAVPFTHTIGWGVGPHVLLWFVPELMLHPLPWYGVIALFFLYSILYFMAKWSQYKENRRASDPSIPWPEVTFTFTDKLAYANKPLGWKSVCGVRVEQEYKPAAICTIENISLYVATPHPRVLRLQLPEDRELKSRIVRWAKQRYQPDPKGFSYASEEEWLAAKLLPRWQERCVGLITAAWCLVASWFLMTVGFEHFRPWGWHILDVAMYGSVVLAVLNPGAALCLGLLRRRSSQAWAYPLGFVGVSGLINMTATSCFMLYLAIQDAQANLP